MHLLLPRRAREAAFLGALAAGAVLAGGSVARAQCQGHWVADLGSGVGGGAINALAPLPGGFVAGGTFTTAGGVNSPHIARWTGSAWAAMGGSGLFNPVLSLAVLGNGSVVAGAGGLLAINPISGRPDYIEQWNGTSWFTMGSGITAGVYGLTTGPDGQLVAGGIFDTAGGGDAYGLASWDGAFWSALGTGTELNGSDSGYVFSVIGAPNGDVYAGGTFGAAGEMDANHIARWDGQFWWPLDTGVSNAAGAAVLAMAFLPNGGLVVGGTFDSAGSVSANNIARWDGSSWFALGAGVSDAAGSASVNALAVMPNGDLVAGGMFTFAGGVGANGVARWDGSSWSPLGTGVTGSLVNTIVKALLVLPNGDLIAGGNFSTAGGLAAAGIARWTTACGAHCSADFNHDGAIATDADIDAFFACLAGTCCPACGSPDFNGDGAVATDADIESFFRVLAGGPC